jgi:hypothetical protein
MASSQPSNQAFSPPTAFQGVEEKKKTPQVADLSRRIHSKHLLFASSCSRSFFVSSVPNRVAWWAFGYSVEIIP